MGNGAHRNRFRWLRVVYPPVSGFKRIVTWVTVTWVTLASIHHDRRRLLRCPWPAEQLHQIRFSVIQQRSRDRKSTRLNSSHQIISYAVFCLKKKKQQ